MTDLAKHTNQDEDVMDITDNINNKVQRFKYDPLPGEESKDDNNIGDYYT